MGNLFIGGDAPLTVQSMTTARGYEGIYAQMKELQEAGCDIVRMTVPDMGNVRIPAKLKEQDIQMPIVADIHFDYRMAVEAAYAGADKVRIESGKHRLPREGSGGGTGLQSQEYCHPGRREQRLFGKEQAGKIRRSHPGGSVRKCPGKCPALGGLRL